MIHWSQIHLDSPLIATISSDRDSSRIGRRRRLHQNTQLCISEEEPFRRVGVRHETGGHRSTCIWSESARQAEGQQTIGA